MDYPQSPKAPVLPGLFFDQSIKGLRQLPRLVRDLQKHWPPSRKVALYGQLGAGKTTFVKQFCKELGIPDVSSSPTFSLINHYGRAETAAYHLDLYRLRNTNELLDLGIEEIFYGPEWCFVEWPQIAADYLPDDFVHLTIDLEEDGSRRFRAYYADTAKDNLPLPRVATS